MYPRAVVRETGFRMARACYLDCEKSSLVVIGFGDARYRLFKISPMS